MFPPVMRDRLRSDLVTLALQDLSDYRTLTAFAYAAIYPFQEIGRKSTDRAARPTLARAVLVRGIERGLDRLRHPCSPSEGS
jgi:hypothetical protein